MDKEAIKHFIDGLWPHLGERQRRLFAAGQAKAIGHGGITFVSEISGLSRVTITKGIKELEDGETLEKGRDRKKGSGRLSATMKDPELLNSLENILDETTRGDPEAPLLWTIKSTRLIARELLNQGHIISHFRVGKIMHQLGYSLQANKKTEEGNQHVDRDEQFKYINNSIKNALKDNQPVLSVDTKKKELVGNYKNNGQPWRKSKNPKKVNGHDFADPSVPRAIPYGIYDLGNNTGFVNVGTNHDTATFAVESIQGWWKHEGSKKYNKVKYILITADGGGSNGSRNRLWKLELYTLAVKLGIPIKVCHFPPGTSKWNKVEHRLFSFISSNWKGEPLCDYETIVNLISNTKTVKGLKVKCRLDRRKYETGRKVTNGEFDMIKIAHDKFHGEWNYTLNPKTL
jgi:transposase